MLSTVLVAGGCAGGSSDSADIIDKPEFKSETGQFDIDALEALGRVSEPKISPDGKKVLYSISKLLRNYLLKENKFIFLIAMLR